MPLERDHSHVEIKQHSSQPRIALSLGLLLSASVFLMALTPVWDPDSWMHLSLGRTLWELKGFPETEPFVYPSADTDFFYTSWLFALTMYFLHAALGSAGLVLLKASVLAGTFFILFQDAVRDRGSPALACLVFTAVILAAKSRFVVRPEIFFLLFLSLTVSALNAFRFGKRRYLFALPLVHLLWANCHSSINQMVVPFGAYVVGGLLQRYLARRGIGEDHVPSFTELKTVTIVFALSALATGLNPNGIDEHLYGYELLSSDWIAQEIMELRRPTGTDFMVVIISGAIVLSSFLLNWRRLPLSCLLLFLPFLTLGFTAVRFIALPAIIGGPLVVRNLTSFLRGRQWDGFLHSRSAHVVAALWVVVFAFLSIADVSPFGIRGGTLGLGSDTYRTPTGAVSYMDRNNITGRVFNSFHFGQYVIWTGYPERTVFIDSRANIPQDLLEKDREVRHTPEALGELRERFGFETLLLDYWTQKLNGRLEETLDLTFRHPDWALVYWDDVAMLYLRRGGQYQKVISEDEYHFVRPQVSLPLFVSQISSDQDLLAPLMAELVRAYRETGSARAGLLLGLTHQAAGNHSDAIRLLTKSQFEVPRWDKQFTLMALGDSYKAMGLTEAALTHYREALALGESTRIHARIGRTMLDLGQADNAITEFSYALKLDESNEALYPLLARAYRDIGDMERAAELEVRAQNLRGAGAGQRHFENGVRAYFEKDYERAVKEYLKSIAINPRVPIVHVNLGHAYLEWGKPVEGRAAFEKALQLEPDHGKAHYGLALAHKALGEPAAAREHFIRYLELDPDGKLARSAKREMERLSGR